MRTLRLYVSLLWRTLAALFLCGFAVQLASVALFQVGIEIPPRDLESSVTYIKLKPTIAYLGFASAVLFSEFVFPANIIRALGGKRLTLSQFGWRRYSLELTALLALLATINVIVAAAASTTDWINFKLYGALFILLAGIYLLAYRTADRVKNSL